MPARKRQYVLEGLRAWKEGMARAGLDLQEQLPDLPTYHRAHLRCPLLDEEHHACMAYDLRPIACRGHYVLAPDASVCANRANEPVVRTLTVVREGLRACERMVRGDLQALARLTEALLPTALDRALGDMENERRESRRSDLPPSGAPERV